MPHACTFLFLSLQPTKELVAGRCHETIGWPAQGFMLQLRKDNYKDVVRLVKSCIIKFKNLNCLQNLLIIQFFFFFFLSCFNHTPVGVISDRSRGIQTASASKLLGMHDSASQWECGSIHSCVLMHAQQLREMPMAFSQ